MSYVVEVADLFLRRFPHIVMLGPEDYTIIADWGKREIPVEIVERSIDEACAAEPDNMRNIASVQAIDQSVKQNFREWLQQIPC